MRFSRVRLRKISSELDSFVDVNQADPRTALDSRIEHAREIVSGAKIDSSHLVGAEIGAD